MSEIKVNSIKGVGASAAAITVNNTDGTCTANITNNLSNRNLIINGAMQVAQRGTSSTTEGYSTIDRFSQGSNGFDEVPTKSQSDLASSDTPYTLGFRKAFKITNGNQTSGAQAADFIKLTTKIEAQDVAQSGWNYKSSSSYITLSFWVKSSVAQNFYGRLRAYDGTSQNYPFETGSLSANTWTKITKTIPGNSNLSFNNDNDIGLELEWTTYRGGNTTDSGVTLNAWAAFNSATRTPDQTSTWYTTNDATFEITGVQLEVGSVATDFEHRSFGQELALCQRYYFKYVQGSNKNICTGAYFNSGTLTMSVQFPVEMRAAPSLDYVSGTSYYLAYREGGSDPFDSMTITNAHGNGAGLDSAVGASGTQGVGASAVTNNASSYIAFSSEL